jgi:hypothetical protein
MASARPPGRRAAPLALAALAVPLLLARAAIAAAPAIDADLLEFLGSVDSEEPGWHDFLAGNALRPGANPVGKLPGATPPAASTPPPAPTPPPARKVKDT